MAHQALPGGALRSSPVRFVSFMLGIAAVSTAAVGADATYSWRYYRPGNTGIQGDYNEAIWIAPDGDPWIGGYNPNFEEGGIAKFVQAENRWINVSNIDYPVIGHPEETACTRVSDMVADQQGNLWIGTGRGVLRMNLAAGPSSLVRFGPGNSALPGGWTTDISLAPDGTIWISAYSTAWAAGGLTRYNPATNTWTHFNNHGGGNIAAQPKPGGGYYIWSTTGAFDPVDRWDSTTQAWTTFTPANGNPSMMFSNDSVDAAGNVWMIRHTNVSLNELTLDCLRPDGTWVQPSLPPLYAGFSAPFAALKALGPMRALVIVIGPDGAYHLQRFDGSSWADLGIVPHTMFIDDLEVDAAGNVWVCGTGQGGALRRDAITGEWQRYRVTNTSQFDFFNNDLAIDPVSGDVYACANAAAGYGGMVKFDGARWTGFNNHHYGLGVEWPFPTDNSEAVYVRPSNGRVVVNPMFNFTHDYDPETSAFSPIPGGPDTMRQYREDSLGRLWGIGHYGGLGYYENGVFNVVGAGGWGMALHADTSRPGTVWANLDFEITRTDGAVTFTRGVGDFPEAGGGTFTGLAVDRNGKAWFGTWWQFTSTGSTLIKLDPDTGAYQVWSHDSGWPFPGEHVRPLTVTPDGRLWMIYDSEFPSTEMGLLWWDGTNVGTFPAPPNGEPQWGGLPHAGIKDIEVKPIPGGYELWMSCLSRGIAVLTVTGTMCPPDFNGDGFVTGDDFDAYVAEFVAGNAAADFNRDGFVTGDDFDAFVAAFEAGC